jgi:hypothetical protein
MRTTPRVTALTQSVILRQPWDKASPAGQAAGLALPVWIVLSHQAPR